MKTIQIPAEHQGSVEGERMILAQSVLDVVLSPTGEWVGHSAEAFNAALASEHGFAWPRRIRNLKTERCSVELVEQVGWAQKGSVPATVGFYVDKAQPGARITGEYLHEIW